MLTEKQNKIVRELIAEFEDINSRKVSTSKLRGIFDEKKRQDDELFMEFKAIEDKNLSVTKYSRDADVEFLNDYFDGTNLIAVPITSEDGVSHIGIDIKNKTNSNSSTHSIHYCSSFRTTTLNNGKRISHINGLEYLYFNKGRYKNLQGIISDSSFADLLFKLNNN